MYDQVVKCQRAGLCLSEHFLISDCNGEKSRKRSQKIDSFENPKVLKNPAQREPDFFLSQCTLDWGDFDFNFTHPRSEG